MHIHYIVKPLDDEIFLTRKFKTRIIFTVKISRSTVRSNFCFSMCSNVSSKSSKTRSGGRPRDRGQITWEQREGGRRGGLGLVTWEQREGGRCGGQGQVTWEQGEVVSRVTNLWHECELKEYSTKLLCILRCWHPKQNSRVISDLGKVEPGLWFCVVSIQQVELCALQLCAEWRWRSVPPTTCS